MLVIVSPLLRTNLLLSPTSFFSHTATPYTRQFFSARISSEEISRRRVSAGMSQGGGRSLPPPLPLLLLFTHHSSLSCPDLTDSMLPLRESNEFSARFAKSYGKNVDGLSNFAIAIGRFVLGNQEVGACAAAPTSYSKPAAASRILLMYIQN